METTLNVLNINLNVHLSRIRTIDAWHHTNMPAPFWRLYWNPEPGAWIQRNTLRIHLKPSHHCIVPPGSSLQTASQQACEHLFLHFTINNTLKPIEDRLFQFKNTTEKKRHFDQLRNHLIKRPSCNIQANLLAQSLILESLSQIPTKQWSPPITDLRIQAALSQIHHSNGFHITIPALAKQAHLHPKSFSRLFKEHVGSAPADYMLQLRLNAATRELMYLEHTVEAIAERWHFTDRFHLTRMLKKHRNITPGQLRRFVRWHI